MNNQARSETPAEARARILQEARDRWLQLSQPAQELSLFSTKESAADSQFIINGGHDFYSLTSSQPKTSS